MYPVAVLSGSDTAQSHVAFTVSLCSELSICIILDPFSCAQNRFFESFVGHQCKSAKMFRGNMHDLEASCLT